MCYMRIENVGLRGDRQLPPQRERVSVGFVGDPPAQMGEENIVQCPQAI